MQIYHRFNFVVNRQKYLSWKKKIRFDGYVYQFETWCNAPHSKEDIWT